MRFDHALLMTALLGPSALAAGPGNPDLWPVAPDVDDPRFDTDVMAVFSKAGCNAGACHGNFRGKGGFQLSLRGQDPQLDHQRLTRGAAGRRINRLDPEQSLILLKPTGQLPHQGGVRFGRDSRQYEILRQWLRRGASGPRPQAPQLVDLVVHPQQAVLIQPDQRLQLRAVARFSDGSQQDVTRAAVYEPSNLLAEVTADGQVRRVRDGESTVVVRYLDQQRPVRVAFVPARDKARGRAFQPQNYIDREVLAKLKRLRIEPSELCSDHEFVRRAHLDLLGLLPTAEEARRFVAERAPDKRRQLIDRLLAHPALADRWALWWSDLLRNEEKVLDHRGVELYHGWIRQAMAQGTPLDEFARQLVSARGSTYDHPPANYYRACRTPAVRGETTAQLFLGVRLQCAQCHNHPFDRWTQDDYYSWTALFARVDYEIVENNRKDKLDKHEFVGEQIVLIKQEGEVQNPRSGRDAEPRFLSGGEGVAAAVSPKADRLEELAQWLTAAENRQFARAQANRIWSQVMGRGLVSPVDDFRLTNPASHPELLEALTDDLIDSGFDLRHLLRRIVSSRTYQLSSEPTASGVDDTLNYSHALVSRLPAEALLDAQCQALDVTIRFEGYDEPGLRAGQLPGVRRVRARRSQPTAGDRFLKAFGKPERLLACSCERSDETTLKQALLLLGAGLESRLAEDGNRVDRLARQIEQGAAPEHAVDELYWASLSRPPSCRERQAALELFKQLPPREALQDVAWALLNSKEFVFRH